MPANPEDLWPESFGGLDIETPISILRKQAAFLGTKTGNVLEGYVSKEMDDEGDFVLTFYLIAPALQNYRYKLLSVWHKVTMYPVHTFAREEENRKPVELNNAKELKNYLQKKFASEETLKIIRSLIVQSQS